MMRRSALLSAIVVVSAAVLVVAIGRNPWRGAWYAAERATPAGGPVSAAAAKPPVSDPRASDPAAPVARASVSVPPGSAPAMARAWRGVDPATTAVPPVAADASQSLVDALRDGDARSPPIVPSALSPERANAAELVDPAAYRRYEQRQQARLYRAFEQEAAIALIDLQRDLARGRAAALPAEQIAEGEDKQRKLAETLERLRRGELGAQ